MHNIDTMWEINSTIEFEQWFEIQSNQNKTAILQRVILLKNFGPNLARPYADVLHGSKYRNLKELRVQTQRSVLRIVYCFDYERKCFLLTAGDKKGKNEKQFYKKLIQEAEQIIEDNKIRT